jgi:hypothetical protein
MHGQPIEKNDQSYFHVLSRGYYLFVCLSKSEQVSTLWGRKVKRLEFQVGKNGEKETQILRKPLLSTGDAKK